LHNFRYLAAASVACGGRGLSASLQGLKEGNMATNEQSEIAIKGLVDSLVAAWNLHDAAAFAKSFAADADFTNVFGMYAKGREAIEQFHAPIFATMFKDSRLSATSIRVRFLRPEIAALDVSWDMVGARDPQGQEWPRRLG
jgi:uncharacterized protein (TIGR02246 family)